jgi:RNA polymerase sigma factor FliA
MGMTPKSAAELMEACQGLVRSCALKIHRGLPEHIELDDLIGYGQVGLAQAARDFDPERGVKFVTFAYYRVRGAIYDGLSQMAWGRRADRSSIQYERMAGEILQYDAEESADNKNSNGLSDEVRWFGDLTRTLAVVYLATHGDEDTDVSAMSLVDHSAPAPPAVATGKEISTKLGELIDRLPALAATLIRAAYFEGLTLQEAGERIGVSKSWASRLHAKTLQQLGNSLRQAGLGDS